jgi:hypothetical protein
MIRGLWRTHRVVETRTWVQQCDSAETTAELCDKHDIFTYFHLPTVRGASETPTTQLQVLQQIQLWKEPALKGQHQLGVRKAADSSCMQSSKTYKGVVGN